MIGLLMWEAIQQERVSKERTRKRVSQPTMRNRTLIREWIYLNMVLRMKLDGDKYVAYSIESVRWEDVNL